VSVTGWSWRLGVAAGRRRPDAAVASGGPGFLSAGGSAPGVDDVRAGLAAGSFTPWGFNSVAGLLIPVCGTSSAKVVYWPARLTRVAQACIRVTAVPWQVRRRDAATAVPAEPALPPGPQPTVSAGQLAWIARLPGTGPVLVCELLVRLPAVC
jgi:hypothetical protein